MPSGDGATIEGDVYLLNKAGDVKPGASNVVVLLSREVALAADLDACVRGPGDARRGLADRLVIRRHLSDSAYAVWEAQRRSDPTVGLPDGVAQALRIAYLATRDSVKQLRFDWPVVSAEWVRRSLERAAERSGRVAPTGMRAHYRFTDVPPGEYVLWSRMALGDRQYHWWAPTVVSRPGESVTRDLDNTVVREGDRACPPLPEEPT